MILKEFQFTRWKDHVHPAQFTCAFESLDSAEACGIAIIVANHHRWVERLKVEHQDGIDVELGLWFEDQWLSLGGVLLSDLCRDSCFSMRHNLEAGNNLPIRGTEKSEQKTRVSRYGT